MSWLSVIAHRLVDIARLEAAKFDDIVHGRAELVTEVSASIRVQPVDPASEQPDDFPQVADPVDPRVLAARLDALAEPWLKTDKTFSWRRSIVDLAKTIRIVSGLNARKEMAREWGYPGSVDAPDDRYSAMNTWLHGEVLRRVREHGIPLGD